MPFDGRWFYGDALFIVDPWVWLILGGAAFLTFSRSRLALVRWTVFALVATWIVVGNAELVPPLLRACGSPASRPCSRCDGALRAASPVALERAAQGALAVTAGYIVVDGGVERRGARRGREARLWRAASCRKPSWSRRRPAIRSAATSSS